MAGIPLSQIQQKIQQVEKVVEETQLVQQQVVQQERKAHRMKKIFPLALITFGSILMANAAWPIVSYTIFESPQLRRVQLDAPVPSEEVLSMSAVASSVMQVDAAVKEEEEPERPKPIILSERLDYTNLSNWFIDPHQVQDFANAQVQESYYIDIPSLDIERAEIVIGGTDLNTSLIQYPGTANPGDYGAPVIFGHSVLRQFYRPSITNPNRYKSIFSKIMTLKTGDEIYVTYRDEKYKYTVSEKHEVQPEDLFILEQKKHSRELKLITCVPEGTYLRRGVVVAQLESIEQL